MLFSSLTVQVVRVTAPAAMLSLIVLYPLNTASLKYSPAYTYLQRYVVESYPVSFFASPENLLSVTVSFSFSSISALPLYESGTIWTILNLSSPVCFLPASLEFLTARSILDNPVRLVDVLPLPFASLREACESELASV